MSIVVIQPYVIEEKQTTICESCQYNKICPGSPYGRLAGLIMKPLGQGASQHDRLVFIETTLCNTYNRLYGNGQPGDIDGIRKSIEKRFDELKRSIDGINDQLGKRITYLERYFWIFVGGVTVIFSVIKLIR